MIMDVNKKTIKRLIIVLAVCLALFAGLNLIWLLSIKIPHDKIVDKIYEGSEISGIFEKPTKDGYAFGIGTIKYLSFNELSIVISNGEPIMITFDMDDGSQEHAGTPSGTLYGIYCHRTWLGKCSYALDCWMPGSDLNFNVVINKDLIVSAPLDMDEDDLQILEEFIDQNRISLQGMMNYAIELWEG